MAAIAFKDIVQKFVGPNFDRHLAEQGAKEVVDILPVTYLMRYAPNPVDLTNSVQEWAYSEANGVNTHSTVVPAVGAPENKRLLKVMRYDGTQYRECKELNFFEFSQAKNSHSIYEAKTSSPVFNIDMDSGYAILKMYPTLSGIGDTGKIIFVSYPNFTNDESAEYIDPYSGDDTYPLFDALGFSKDAVNIMALKAAIYTTQALISDAVQDDEDNELLAMLNAQQASLNSQYEIDIKRLMAGVAI